MFKRILASLFTSVILIGSLGVLAGCNTVRGIGEDIQQGGREIKEEANEHRR